MLVQILAVCLAMLGDPSEEKRFEELFQTYRQLMYSCAYHKLQDPSLAEDMLRLQEEYREALLLKYSQGYHNREIAAILKCSVAKVEKLLSRGKRQLETILEAETDEMG